MANKAEAVTPPSWVLAQIQYEHDYKVWADSKIAMDARHKAEHDANKLIKDELDKRSESIGENRREHEAARKNAERKAAEKLLGIDGWRPSDINADR